MVITGTMNPPMFPSVPSKLRRSRRLSSTRGLVKSSGLENYPSKSSSRYNEDKERSDGSRSRNEKIGETTINWELNERISLSSGSSTGIEIRPDAKRGIGFSDREKADKSSETWKISPKLARANPSHLKSREKLENSSKRVLELMNVSGFNAGEKQSKIATTRSLNVDVFCERSKDKGNVIKSDSKYEIGVPGECTMLRKKKSRPPSQITSKTSKTRLTNDRNDLTGTSARRRWDVSKDKSDKSNDSITKRLELIHELNQKILANYERFQHKSKRPCGKISTSESKGSPKCSLRKKDGGKARSVLSDLKGACDNKEHIYSEIRSKKKSKSSKSTHRDVHQSERVVQGTCKTAEKSGKTDATKDFHLGDRVIRSTQERLESFQNKSKSSVSRALRNLGGGSASSKPAKKPPGSNSNSNFSLAVKPEFHDEAKIPAGVQGETPIKALCSKFEETGSSAVEMSREIFSTRRNNRSKNDDSQRSRVLADSRKPRGEATLCLENSKLYPESRYFDAAPTTTVHVEEMREIESPSNKDDTTCAEGSSVSEKPEEPKPQKVTSFRSENIVNRIEFMESRRQEILEKEILDNLNETIGRFDNETELDELDPGDDGTESFSTDSIQSTSPSKTKNGTTVNAENTCHQETFNSSWDSGVGIDVGTGNGWVRIHTGIESSLVYLTLDTTAKDVCRDMLLGEELSIFIQYGGEPSRRLAPHERPLECQDEFLKQLGYEEISRRTRLGVDPELRHLIAFHVGPTAPQADLTGYSRCGNALVLKGLVFPQWKRRSLAVIGSRLFLYPSCPDSRPEWMELGGVGGAVCYAPSRLGKLVLRVTGFPRVSNAQRPHQEDREFEDERHHQETRHLYLGFQHPWDRDLWRGWLKKATQTSESPKQLDLNKSGLMRIPDSILAFSAIEEILLSGNQLGNDDANLDILERFPHLRKVRIGCNALKSVPREIFKVGLLTTLDLSDNRIAEVPADIDRLVNLRELILDRNVIERVSEGVGRLQNLKVLSLADNLITALPCFLNMRALALTDVLSKAEHGKNCKEDKNTQNNLHKVNLRNNQLKGSIILGNYGNLTHLDVSENSIEKLDVSALQGLQSARCARNALTELTLCGRNLVSLIAGNNKLKKLIIEPAPMNLEHLDVSYNSLEALPEWIPDLPVLRALFASHNALTALPDRLLSQPSRLEVLHLPHNRLQALPPPRNPLNIVHLTLQGNALTALPTSFFANTERMKVLNLSNNRLSELPYSDEGCKSRSSRHTLEKLYLTGNCLTDAALDALAKLPALRVLHLAYNVLDTLPESCIAAWSDLEELVMSGNRLQYLPDNVANLQHLRVLRVHSNRLLTCPTFNKSKSLMVLDLAHNQLDRINLASLVPPQLQFLDISCNTRLHVDPRQFQVYRSQRPVSLVDVSGQNRASLPSHPHQQEIVRSEKGLDQPWRLGFSETAGSRETLYVSQLRMPTFCNVEGVFGIFDGGTNQEAPSALQEMIPRLLLEERTIRETSKDYLKYTLLSAHRELKENGQKYGTDATLVHITRIPSVQGYPRTSRKYSLKVAASGEAKAVLCRAAGPLVLAPTRKNVLVKNQLGNAAMFPLVVPDPTVEEVNLEDDDEFVIIANRRLWEVLSVQEAVREARAEASPVLAAKRLQDLAQAYGAEDNISVIVLRLTGPGTGDLDQLMRELRHAVTKSRGQGEGSCSCPCCLPPNPHKPPAPCCCHVNDGYYLNGVLKNIVNRGGNSRNGSGRFFKNGQNTENASLPYNDDRSSPSGQSDQTSDSTFKIRHPSGRGWSGSAASRAATKNRQGVMIQENGARKFVNGLTAPEDAISERSGGPLSEEQFRCWEYMLEQNTQLLFDKELDTLARVPLRRGQSRSTPQLAGNLPFLSKRFGSARSFNPVLPRAPMMRFGSGRRFLNGGPNAAYFGSLQRLMPYNLEYDFAVIQERAGLDSLEQDASRMQQYWGVATTEL
ncbi:uncharacterized protein Phlpp [Venturia canescens]|uniref:uncharacterized protein Phlpp n=1 Tax=Venturia canescens TaxID=32260 RepID=UPI001C9CB746|nr:uncharacterized protein LOC122410820 [Venturia canescens]